MPDAGNGQRTRRLRYDEAERRPLMDVDVQSPRACSRGLAAAISARHEALQVLSADEGIARWNVSEWAGTRAVLLRVTRDVRCATRRHAVLT